MASEQTDAVVDSEKPVKSRKGASSATDMPQVAPGVVDELNEILREADLAKHTMAFTKTDAPESAPIPDINLDTVAGEVDDTKKAEDNERMIQRLRARASRQREIGYEQLVSAPKRKGDMSLPLEIEVYEFPISNMIKRFVSIADRLMSRLHGYGALIMGEETAAKSIEILTGYIDELHKDARNLHDQTTIAFNNHKAKREAEGTDWLVPAYSTKAMGDTVHLMRREGNKMLQAFILYDKSVKMLRVLEWNEGTEIDEIDQIVVRARRQGSKIFRAALAGQIELGNRLNKRGSGSNSRGVVKGANDTPAIGLSTSPVGESVAA